MNLFETYMQRINESIVDHTQFDKYTREQLIDMCQANDPNGVYSDTDSTAEGYEPMTREELIQIILNWMDEENIATVDEFIKVIQH